MHKFVTTEGGSRCVNVDAALVITPINKDGGVDWERPVATQYVYPGLVLTVTMHPRDAPLPKGVKWPVEWTAEESA